MKPEINGDIPLWLKWIMTFIDRVGFPILAFCMMFWMCYVSITKVTEAIQDNTKVLVSVSGRFDSFSDVFSDKSNAIIANQEVIKRQTSRGGRNGT